MAKKELKQDVQSVFEKMAEAYRDCDEQKRRIMSTLKATKKRFEAEDIDEAAVLGKMESDNLKLLDNLIDKKIKLVQMHIKIVAPTIKSADNSAENVNPSQLLDQNMLDNLRKMAEREYRKEIKYDLDED